MKKILTLVLALALSITALSGCGSKPAADKTPEELAELYSSAIMENGGEMAEYNPAFTQAKEDDGSAMVLENMGLNTEDMAAFGHQRLFNEHQGLCHCRHHARRGQGGCGDGGASGLYRPYQVQL